jgi:predicted Zn-dependent protease
MLCFTFAVVFFELLLASHCLAQNSTAAGTSATQPPVLERVRVSEIPISTPQPYDPAQITEAQYRATSAQSDHAQAVPSPGESTTVASAAFAAFPDAIGEAKVLFRKGHFDAALQKYQELLQRQPRSPDAYAGMIRVYLKMKNVQQAYETATSGGSFQRRRQHR